MRRHYNPPNSERESMRTDTEENIIAMDNVNDHASGTESDRRKIISDLISLKINELQCFIAYRFFIIAALALGLLYGLQSYMLLLGLTIAYIVLALVYFRINRKYFNKKTRMEHVMNILLEAFLLSSLAACSILEIPYSFCSFALLLGYIIKMYFSCGCGNDVSLEGRYRDCHQVFLCHILLIDAPPEYYYIA